MGSVFATELASNDLNIGMETAIGIHLRSNHYPPVPLTMVQPCIDAIDAYWEEDLGRSIELPEGVLWRGETSAPAYAIIESHHLESWCQDDYVEEDYE